MARTSDPDYVAGAGPPYKIQPPIVHPPFCVCDKCSSLPAEERTRPHTIRVLRASRSPNSRTLSTVHALELKTQLERELRNRAAAGGERRSGPMSIADIFDLFFTTNPKRVSEETIKRDRCSARNIIRLLDASVPPDHISEREAVRYRNAREKEGAAARTIQDELSLLLRILNFGLRWRRDTGMETVSLYELPELGETEPCGVALSEEEFAAVLAIAKPRDRYLIIAGVTTMLRRTPLMALQRPWVSADRRWLSVPAAFMKKGRARQRSPLEIPIAEWTVDTLNAVETSKEGYYWPSSKTGEPMVWVEHIFSDLSTRAAVREFSCHDLRTTGSSWLANAGVDEFVIAMLLGHRSTFDPGTKMHHARGGSVTRGYTKLFESTMRAGVAVFDDVRRRVELTAKE
jgi:integrase